MGEYVYTLKGPKHNIKVDINGQIESVALLVFHYKPIYSFWDKEPRWQILAKARCERMHNVWEKHGFPKYIVHVFVEDDSTINFTDVSVCEWPVKGATISDGSIIYDTMRRVGKLGTKNGKVYSLVEDSYIKLPESIGAKLEYPTTLRVRINK